MSFRHSLLIFLIGILVGIGVSPLADTKPQRVFLSPIAVSMAEESWSEPQGEIDGEVLGATIQNPEEAIRQEIADLLSRQDQEFSQSRPEISDYRGQVTIALYGDSMVDTMETGLPYLDQALKKYYPEAQFKLLNYGIGAQNIETAWERLGQDYHYKDRDYPPITQLGANLIILESFAYNPMGESGLDTQWLKLSQMVSQAQASGSKVMLLATIAPTRTKFGQGPGGVNWPAETAWQQAELIKKYLENTLRLAENLGVPVVDAYHASLLSDGEANLTYINANDHIHPSVAGERLISELIAKKIYRLGLIQ